MMLSYANVLSYRNQCGKVELFQSVSRRKIITVVGGEDPKGKKLRPILLNPTIHLSIALGGHVPWEVE